MQTSFNHPDQFINRHIGPSESDIQQQLDFLKLNSVEELIDQTIPKNIRLKEDLTIGNAISEQACLTKLKELAEKNKVFHSLIGQGYNNTFTPSVIRRNILENPGWYTQYTPYQSEISQGRLEALLNFQTVVSDLTGLPIANASLLDEGTAAAEAMLMLRNFARKKQRKKTANIFLVDEMCFEQSKAILETRASGLNIEIQYFNKSSFELVENAFGVLLQYPDKEGNIEDIANLIEKAKSDDLLLAAASDLMALTLLKSPAEYGFDICFGNTQRFGVPIGFGGPHAAFFSCTEPFLRMVPGRIIGVSKDVKGKKALRMTLQTREQHIKRDKATSNICTAQALLAIMASMYAVYHGPKQLKEIGKNVHLFAKLLQSRLKKIDIDVKHPHFYDTLCFEINDSKIIERLKKSSEVEALNFWYEENKVQIAFDETCDLNTVQKIENIFKNAFQKEVTDIVFNGELSNAKIDLPSNILRKTDYLSHPVFNSYHSETEMMRYIKHLENKDLSLTHSMIPLGSCTMKLNAATQLLMLTHTGFSSIHPFVPAYQAKGYFQLFEELESLLANITGMEACSLQPNSGAQGEYTGLMVIKAYHKNNDALHRTKMIIPKSAHGTNPASAVIAGFDVVLVDCEENGDIDVKALKEKAELHKDNLGGIMITYPSTHGVFEESIQEICAIIHENGGMVYMDGANMNAQVGLTSPGICGADVVHLNLHKTFAIPHGGGGPGMGPICVNAKLAPFLPSHPYTKSGGEKAIKAVSAAAYGSASILIISYAYIKMLGSVGLKRATEVAILNANYLKSKLEQDFAILYTGKKFGRVAHELIIDTRPFDKSTDISVTDIAKRLIDYGFHAPTMSWPVAGTMMVEPTESESLKELDRFVEAMRAIRKEIEMVENSSFDKEDNPLKNAPHTMLSIANDAWQHKYSRKEAAYPVDSLLTNKFWSTVSRVDNAFGDKNVICTCPAIEDYEEVV